MRVAALRHPNIIPIFYIGQEGSVVFFSMSYLEGETFEHWIEGKRWFNEDQAKWFLSHAVAALHSAHKANIVHLDIKPANFLVDRANNIMLTDFGLAPENREELRGSLRARGLRHSRLCCPGADFPSGDRPAHRHLFPRRHPLPSDDRSAAL